MLTALNDARYTGFVAGLSRRIEKHDLALFSGTSANVPLLEASRPLLERFLKKAVKAVAELDVDSEPEALHAARKQVRRLRYGLDFLGALYGAPAKRLRKQAKLIQDHLGEHQDAIVAQDVLWSVIEELRDEGEAGPETYVAIGQALQRETRHGETARSSFFAERKRFLKLGKRFKTVVAASPPEYAAGTNGQPSQTPAATI